MHYCNTKNRIKLSLAPRKLQDRRYLKQHMYCAIQMFWLAVMSLFFLHLGSLIAHMKDDEWPLWSRLVNAVEETFGLGNTRCLHMRVKVRPRHSSNPSFPALLCYPYSKRAAVLTLFSGCRSKCGMKTKKLFLTSRMTLGKLSFLSGLQFIPL